MINSHGWHEVVMPTLRELWKLKDEYCLGDWDMYADVESKIEELGKAIEEKYDRIIRD